MNDYGTIFLCDERFGSSTFEISKWMKERRKIYDRKNIEKLQDDVKAFYKLNIERFSMTEELLKKKREKKAAKKAASKKEQP